MPDGADSRNIGGGGTSMQKRVWVTGVEEYIFLNKLPLECINFKQLYSP